MHAYGASSQLRRGWGAPQFEKKNYVLEILRCLSIDWNVNFAPNIPV
jgi:hypothetical protein